MKLFTCTYLNLTLYNVYYRIKILHSVYGHKNYIRKAKPLYVNGKSYFTRSYIHNKTTTKIWTTVFHKMYPNNYLNLVTRLTKNRVNPYKTYLIMIGFMLK